MHVVFALLVDHVVHNLVRKYAVEVNRTYGVGLRAALLPPHVTLKQSFDVTDLAELERFFIQFAASIPRFEAHATKLDVVGSRVLWIDIEETPILRDLHSRLNSELAATFPNTEAPFDGPTYHFHTTVALGHEPSPIYDDIATEYAGRRIDVTWEVDRIALFLQNDAPQPTTLTYMIMPVGNSAHRLL